jgi:hypothetical protein
MLGRVHRRAEAAHAEAFHGPAGSIVDRAEIGVDVGEDFVDDVGVDLLVTVEGVAGKTQIIGAMSPELVLASRTGL